jgi:hypothetical protein
MDWFEGLLLSLNNKFLMIKVVRILIFSLLTSSLFGQALDTETVNISKCRAMGDTIHGVPIMRDPEVKPKFESVQGSLPHFVGKNFDLPKSMYNKPYKVMLGFVVDQYGKVSQPCIVNRLKTEPLNKELEESLVKVVAKMPVWIPASHKGVNVPVRMFIPVANQSDKERKEN